MEEVLHVSFKLCELCNDQAALFCPSDSAFLCIHCDEKVHQANFLVARHLRLPLCSQCNSLTKNRFSHYSPRPAFCTSCSLNFSTDDSDLRSVSSSSSSTCVSSTQSSGTTQRNIGSTGKINSAASCELARSRNVKLRDPKAATGLFMHWCAKLGMYGDEGTVQTACVALGSCFGRFRALPVRVGLAACLWYGLRINDDGSKSTWRSLKRLEEISGVPAKLILATELKLRKIVKANNRRCIGMEESWGEWSP